MQTVEAEEATPKQVSSVTVNGPVVRGHSGDYLYEGSTISVDQALMDIDPRSVLVVQGNAAQYLSNTLDS